MLARKCLDETAARPNTLAEFFMGTATRRDVRSVRAPGKAIPMEQERRRSPRFPFIASAQVHADGPGSQLAARISDISASGCYVDTINPLPDGTPVRVKIFNEAKSFEAGATVVYSHTHLGMGLRFHEIPPNSLNALQDWLPTTV